jgi:hypothetical protein
MRSTFSKMKMGSGRSGVGAIVKAFSSSNEVAHVGGDKGVVEECSPDTK